MGPQYSRMFLETLWRGLLLTGVGSKACTFLLWPPEAPGPSPTALLRLPVGKGQVGSLRVTLGGRSPKECGPGASRVLGGFRVESGLLPPATLLTLAPIDGPKREVGSDPPRKGAWSPPAPS